MDITKTDGKQIHMIWESALNKRSLGYTLTNSNFNMREILKPTFCIKPELQKKVEKEWKEYQEKNPSARNLPLWRFDKMEYSRPKDYYFHVSPIDYAYHIVLRNHDERDLAPNIILQNYDECDLFPSIFPNPLSVNAVQETSDGFLLAGIKSNKLINQTN